MLKRLILLVSLALFVAACGEPAPTNPDPDPDPDPSVEIDLTGDWTMVALNDDTGGTINLILELDNTADATDVTGTAYFGTDTADKGDAKGTISGTLNEDALSFRLEFDAGAGGGYWDITATADEESFSGTYVTVNSDTGTVTASKAN